jgi:hypothetical protein
MMAAAACTSEPTENTPDVLAETVDSDTLDPGVTLEIEPNDDAASATRFEVGQTIAGHIETTGDTDVWVVPLEKWTFLTLESPGGIETTIRLAYTGTVTLTFLGEDLTLETGATHAEAPIGGPPTRIFVPETGDYRLTVTGKNMAWGSYQIRTSAGPLTQIPLPSEVPLAIRATPRQQHLYRFVAPYNMLLTHPAFCPSGFNSQWCPGGAWAYHPTDDSVRVVFGGFSSTMSGAFRGACAVVLRAGQEVHLVSPGFGGDLPFDDEEVLLWGGGGVNRTKFFPLPIAPGETIEGRLGQPSGIHSFVLDDPSLAGSRVTLELETYPANTSACLSLMWFDRHERHGPRFAPLQEPALADAAGRVTLSFIPSMAGVPRGMNAIHIWVGHCGTATTPPVSGADFDYRLSISAEPLDFAPLPANGEISVVLEGHERRLFESAVSPGTCTYVRAVDILGAPWPVVLTSNVPACPDYPDVLACADPTSESLQLRLGVNMADALPNVARFSVSSFPIAPLDIPSVEDSPDNHGAAAAQQLVAPVVVSAGPVTSRTEDHFSLRLEHDEVLLLTLETTPPADPACGEHIWAGIPRVDANNPPSTPSTCTVLPDHPGWWSWDVDWVGLDHRGTWVTAFRAPMSGNFGVTVIRDGDCPSLQPYKLYLQVLPAPASSR